MHGKANAIVMNKQRTWMTCSLFFCKSFHCTKLQ